MLTVTVDGRENITEDIVEHLVNILGLDDFEGSLTVIEADYCSDAIGQCYHDDNDVVVEVGIAHDETRDDALITLCHEMIHAYQILSGRLQVGLQFHRWDDTLYPVDTPYLECPWEKQAIGAEQCLYNELQTAME